LFSQFILLFLHAMMLLAVSEFESGAIDLRHLIDRYNAWQVRMMWFHFFVTILSLSPPVTSGFVGVVSGCIALINFRRASKDQLLIHCETASGDVKRVKCDGLIRLILYVCAAGGSIAVVAHTPLPPIVYPVV
jgi:hypothetical protein